MITQIIKKISRINLIVSLIIILSLFCFIEICQAEKDKGIIKTTTLDKTVQGEISWIGKDYIAIIYQKDEKKGKEYEILLPIDADIQLLHKSNLDQLSVGDTVRVQFEELTEEYKEGARKERKAKVISFVKPAVKKPESLESGEVLISY